MIKLISNISGGWSNTYAWMVDKNGIAVPVENHVQKGEPVEEQLDVYGLVVALHYGEITGDREYYQAAATLIQDEVFNLVDIGDEDSIIDLEEEVKWLVEPCHVCDYLKALQLSSFKISGKELIALYLSRDLKYKVEDARRTLRTLFERLMMRVRVGGVINTVSGNTDIYFRIPDSTPNGWYTAIGNFLYDHPQYIGFTLHIYEESGSVGSRKELESYTDGGEFIDLHSSKAPTPHKGRRLTSSRKRKTLLNARFLNHVEKAIHN